MHLLQWSFHIRDIGVNGLETLTFSNAQLKDQILSLKKRYNCEEVFYLATCNRVEFLLANSKKFKNIFPDFTQYTPQTLTSKSEIIEYWLRVCSSLDSVVFGENQIIGQVKKAFIELQKQNLVGSKLAQFMNLVFRESKWIRNHSNLSRIQTSVSSVAAKKVISEFPEQANILLVGFGETNQLVYKYLRKKQRYSLTITNRTLKTAEEGVDSNAQVLPWQDFSKNHLSHYDIVILAVANQRHLLTEDKLKALTPNLVLDLSVPANADESLVKNYGMYVGLNEIKTLVEKNKESSEELVQEVKNLVKQSTQNILEDYSQKDLDQIIAQNIQKSSQIHELSFSNNKKLLKEFTPEQIETMKLFSEQLIKKINHVHLTTMKKVYSELTKSTGR